MDRQPSLAHDWGKALLLHEIGVSLVISGFRYLFLVNGHGGNHEVIQLVAGH